MFLAVSYAPGPGPPEMAPIQSVVHLLLPALAKLYCGVLDLSGGRKKGAGAEDGLGTLGDLDAGKL